MFLTDTESGGFYTLRRSLLSLALLEFEFSPCRNPPPGNSLPSIEVLVQWDWRYLPVRFSLAFSLATYVNIKNVRID